MPGVDADDDYNDFAFVLPGNAGYGYLPRKMTLAAEKLGDATKIWEVMAGTEGLPDQSARIAALTELERSLLVEAGAGSGKTSIMAGRVAMLFARGIEPKRVAAITFTKFAASELMIRITHFVVALAKGKIPRDLEIAFPGGVSAEQRANLERAKKSLDQLLCSTIHGFAQALIKPYPVEAGIDPGAEIIDPSERRTSRSANITRLGSGTISRARSTTTSSPSSC